MTLLTATSLYRQFGPRRVLDGATFTLEDGEHVGFVGVNGSGKSTLLRILAGLETADSGAVTFRRGTTIGYVAQEPELEETFTIRQEMEAALVRHQTALQAYAETTSRLAAGAEDEEAAVLLARLEALQLEIDFLGGYDLSHQIERTLTPLGIDHLERSIGSLSGGERKRVAIARGLLQRPGLLIMDEPTNHLDADSVLWLEAELASYPGGVLLVTHDRYFLDNIVTRIIEVNEGRLTSYPGHYADYLATRAEQLAIAERAEANRQNLMRRELEWLRTGPKARTTKAKSRVQRATDLISQRGPAQAKAAGIDFGNAMRMGNIILRLEHVSHAFGGRPLIRDLTLDLAKGEKLGIIGPNGAGKTTLLKLVVGELSPNRGSVDRGKNTTLLYFDQTRELLDPDKTIWEEVADQGDYVEVAGRKMHIVSYLEDFLFPSGVHRMPIRSLSGGERNRVLLAKLMKRRCNLLILDEPTNDLDLITLQVLEAAIARFDGCVLTVTHDRFFLNRIATSILAFEGDGRVIKYEGDYDTYRSLKEQNERGAAREQAEAPSATVKGAAPGRSVSERKRVKKLTWSEERELEKLPEMLEALEAERAQTEAQLADPSTYTFTQGTKLRELTARLEALDLELRGLYARWEELEEKKEGAP